MDLEKFSQEFKLISKQGFIKSTRKGPTGVGHTLESLLNLTENNIYLSDLTEAELKAHRNISNSLITLFTFNRKAWKMPPLEAVNKYGSLDANGRKGLYYTMSLVPNSAGLFLNIEDTHISVQHISGEVVAEWQLSDLAQRFQDKIPALVLVSAFVEERDSYEYFHYYRAQLMQTTSPELLANQFKAMHIVVDLRLHDNNTRARNHGTGFRVFENKLPQLFMNITDIL